MNLCPDCGNPLDEAGFTNCGRGERCLRDRDRFNAEVAEIKGDFTLQLLASIEQNAMPDCFEPNRATVVALAQLLMQALRQNQELLSKIPKH